MADIKSDIEYLKSGTRWPKQTVTPVSVPKVQVSSEEWNKMVGVIDEHEKHLDAADETLGQLGPKISNTDIQLNGIANITINGYMSTNKWTYMGNTAYNMVVVPVKSGDTITVKATSSGNPIAVVTAFDNPSSNDNIAFSSATGFTARIVQYLNAGEKTYTMPSDAKFFAIGVKNNGNNIKPTVLKKNDVSILKGLADSVATNTTNISTLTSSVSTLNEASTSHGTAITSLDGRVSNVENGTLATVSPIDKFEIGHIATSNSGWSYGANTARARTKQGTTLSIKKGDVIGLTDYSNYRYAVGILRDGSYSVVSWQTANLTFSNPCNAVIVISRINNETALANVGELASLFFVKPYNSIANDVERLRNEAITTDKLKFELKGGSVPGTSLPFEIGHVAMSDSGWIFGANTKRIRTTRGTPLVCGEGDVFSLSDYTNYRMAIGWRVNGQYGATNGWLKTDYTCRYDGEYEILIARNQNAETDLENVEELSALFTYKKVGVISETAGTGILAFNPKYEVLPRLRNLTRPYIRLGGSATEYPPVLTFIHYSDIHASSVNIMRVKNFYDEYSSHLDFVLDTGDFIGNSWSEGLPASVEQIPNFIRVIGNHDTQNLVGTPPNHHWETVSILDCYNTNLAGYIENWGAVQPTDAATIGYCYFYKDFAANNVRLICLDGEHWDTTELTWFEGVLADAKTNGLHVVVAVHRPPFPLARITGNTFDSIDWPNSSGYNVMSGAADAVNAFMAEANGVTGHFVCWLCGHIHQDCMGLGSNDSTSNQLVISIATASYFSGSGEMARVLGDKTQDCFNIVGIDTHSSLLKLIRIGAQYDRHMRKRDTLCWNYATRSLVYCG